MLSGHQVLSGAARDPTRRTTGFWGALTALYIVLKIFTTVLCLITSSLQPGRSELWLQHCEKALGCLQTCSVHRARAKASHSPIPLPAHPGAAGAPLSSPATPVPSRRAKPARLPDFSAQGNAAKRCGQGGRAAPLRTRRQPCRWGSRRGPWRGPEGRRASSGRAEASAAGFPGCLRDSLSPRPPHSRPTWPRTFGGPGPAAQALPPPRPAPPRPGAPSARAVLPGPPRVPPAARPQRGKRDRDPRRNGRQSGLQKHSEVVLPGVPGPCSAESGAGGRERAAPEGSWGWGVVMLGCAQRMCRKVPHRRQNCLRF